MTTTIKNWRTKPNGKEKYQLYLASREWAVLKEAVRARSGGKCERCLYAPGEQVHHQTYERVYAERLDDLLHVCAPCHEFVSGKRQDDPIHDLPIRLFGRTIESVYLAGKITGTTWRDEILVEGWSFQNHGGLDLSELQYGHREWEVTESCLPLPDGRSLDFTGPYWLPLDRGGHSDVGLRFGPHAYGRPYDHDEGDGPRDFSDPVMPSLDAEIRRAIRRSSLIFAWIDAFDCYGTLIEIGYALGLGIPVVVACPPDFNRDEHWMAFGMANARAEGRSPRDAWRDLWSYRPLQR